MPEPVEGSEGRHNQAGGRRTEARARKPDHETEPSLVIGGICRALVAGGGTIWGARQAALDILGERHPVTEALHGKRGYSGVTEAQRAMMAASVPQVAFIVPPDYVAELIEVLRPMTVVRDSGPRTLAMPRGTMQMPRQNQAATATYGGETQAIPVSQQAVGQIVASYKKLTALTQVTNDLLRYSDPNVDGVVRDDLAQVIARREDLAFVRGDGTADSPKGFAEDATNNNVSHFPALQNLSLTARANCPWMTKCRGRTRRASAPKPSCPPIATIVGWT